MKKRSRPKLPAVSEEMKAWAAALGRELTTWPQVSSRAMFGFTALYRGQRIFAVLPRTRGMGSASSLAFKLEQSGPRVRARLKQDARVSTTIMQASRWFVFEVESERDLNDALDWLGRAYEASGDRRSGHRGK
jgi:TfoX/Sxy family transcriptional regulator of competence genes